MPDYDVTVQVELTGIISAIGDIKTEVSAIKSSLSVDGVYSLIHDLQADIALIKGEFTLIQPAIVGMGGSLSLFGGETGLVAMVDAIDKTLQILNLKVESIKTSAGTLATQLSNMADTAYTASGTLSTLAGTVSDMDDHILPIADRISTDGDSVQAQLEALGTSLSGDIDDLRDRIATSQHGTLAGALIEEMDTLDETLASVRDRVATQEQGTLATVVHDDLVDMVDKLDSIRDRIATEEDGTLAAAIGSSISDAVDAGTSAADLQLEQLTAIAGAIEGIQADGVPWPDNMDTTIEGLGTSLDVIADRIAADGQSVGDLMTQQATAWEDVPGSIAGIEADLATLHQDSVDTQGAIGDAGDLIESTLAYGLMKSWTRDQSGVMISGTSWSSMISTAIETFAFSETDIDIIGTTGTVTRIRQLGPVLYVPGS